MKNNNTASVDVLTKKLKCSLAQSRFSVGVGKPWGQGPSHLKRGEVQVDLCVHPPPPPPPSTFFTRVCLGLWLCQSVGFSHWPTQEPDGLSWGMVLSWFSSQEILRLENAIILKTDS